MNPLGVRQPLLRSWPYALFGTEPVIEIMTIFSATLFIECVSPKPNLLF